MVIIMKKNDKTRDRDEVSSLKAKDKNVKSKTKNAKKKLTQADIKKYPSNQIDHVIYKIKANERKYTIIIVCVILVIFLSCSYIIFSSIQKANVKPVFKIGSLSYEFGETRNGLGDIISLVDVSPLKDEDGLKTKRYKIKIRNNSKVSKEYRIFIIDDKEMIQYDECSDKLVERNFIRYSLDDKNISSLDDEDVAIVSGKLKPNETVQYTLKVWISDNYSHTDGLHYHGKIVVKQDEKNS